MKAGTRIKAQQLLIFTMCLCLVFFESCSSQKQLSAIKVDEVISEFLGSPFESETNSSNDLVLAWRLDKRNKPEILRYAVWEVKSGQQIYSGTALQGKVKWLDEMSLEVHDYPGIIDDQNPLYRYKIDLKTKSKTPLSEENRL